MGIAHQASDGGRCPPYEITTRLEWSIGPTLARWRSGPEAAVGAEGRHVRGLVEEPETVPFVAGLAEVFGVDEQLLDPLGLEGRIMRQGDRGAALGHAQGRHHEG